MEEMVYAFYPDMVILLLDNLGHVVKPVEKCLPLSIIRQIGNSVVIVLIDEHRLTLLLSLPQ